MPNGDRVLGGEKNVQIYSSKRDSPPLCELASWIPHLSFFGTIPGGSVLPAGYHLENGFTSTYCTCLADGELNG